MAAVTERLVFRKTTPAQADHGATSQSECIAISILDYDVITYNAKRPVIDDDDFTIIAQSL